MLFLFGDWGLGIGDWAQSPIPNPQLNITYEICKLIKNNISYRKNNNYIKKFKL